MSPSIRGCSNNQFVYYQLGAPALVYYQEDSDWLDAPIASGRSSAIQTTQQRLNRAKFLWNVPFGHGLKTRNDSTPAERQSDADGFPLQNQSEKRNRRRKCKGAAKPNFLNRKTASQEFDSLFDAESVYRKKRVNSFLSIQRHALLRKSRNDDEHGNDDNSVVYKKKRRSMHSPGLNMDFLNDYQTFDYPYIPGFLRKRRGGDLKLPRERFVETRRFTLDRELSDPAYLAPFGIDVLNTLETEKEASIEKTMLEDNSTAYKNQGNCLVVTACPCIPCSQKPQSQRSSCLFHPKGDAMDRLCVSNLITPNGCGNAGHMFRKENLKKGKDFRSMTRHALANSPNEILIGDNILEVKQSGTWNYLNPVCIFVVRTATFVSVVQVMVLKHYNGRGDNYDFPPDVCWGNYALEEKHRIDLRSLSMSTPSLLPTSLACHPEYGNDCCGAKFAFSTCTAHGELNAIHHCFPEAGHDLQLTKHSIPSLKRVSLIDFTSSHPMCLWSAATSFVRPALSRDLRSRQPILGSGSSLFTVDLRDNTATFQWSPSAEEMVTEGVHSISCITTDWQRETTVFVSSNSARKTWEIDARMPCRSVNSWSLSYSTEDTSLTRATKGFYKGRLSMMTRPLETNSTIPFCTTNAPLITIDTTPGSYGLHVLQKPHTRSMFHAENVQCINASRAQLSTISGITTSSVFALPEIANNVYPCGIAAFRAPYLRFGESKLTDVVTDTSDLLCLLTLTNKGDLYSSTLLESKNDVGMQSDSANLPIGVKALCVPKDIDGKMRNLDYKHWKPTGGMNLQLYLTNQLPTPRGAMTAKGSPQSSSALFYKSIKSSSNKLTIGSRLEKVIPVDKKNACEFMHEISDINLSIESRLAGDESVLVPRAMSEKANKGIKLHEASQTNECDDSIQQRSDLSQGLIRTAFDKWSDLHSDAEDRTLKSSSPH